MKGFRNDRLTTRRILAATFWFAAALGLWRFALSMRGPPFTTAGEWASTLSGLVGTTLLGAAVGALFGRTVKGVLIVVCIMVALALLSLGGLFPHVH